MIFEKKNSFEPKDSLSSFFMPWIKLCFES